MERKKLKRNICIIVIVLYVVYLSVATYINVKYYGRVYHYRTDFINISTTLAGLCLINIYSKEYQKRKWLLSIGITVSCISAVTCYILFFVFLPKYTEKEAYAIIKEDPKYISADVSCSEGKDFMIRTKNPYVDLDYEFDVKNSDNSTEHLYFTPDTGEYGTSP